MNGKFSIPFLLTQKHTVYLKVMHTVFKYSSLIYAQLVMNVFINAKLISMIYKFSWYLKTAILAKRRTDFKMRQDSQPKTTFMYYILTTDI